MAFWHSLDDFEGVGNQNEAITRTDLYQERLGKAAAGGVFGKPNLEEAEMKEQAEA